MLLRQALIGFPRRLFFCSACRHRSVGWAWVKRELALELGMICLQTVHISVWTYYKTQCFRRWASARIASRCHGRRARTAVGSLLVVQRPRPSEEKAHRCSGRARTMPLWVLASGRNQKMLAPFRTANVPVNCPGSVREPLVGAAASSRGGRYYPLGGGC